MSMRISAKGRPSRMAPSAFSTAVLPFSATVTSAPAQDAEFLTALRTETAKQGALLIFDEVISGFRVGMGGAAELYGITPDLVTFGKIIGGGMPVGAFAGPTAHFRDLAPNGGIYQAGTLSGNPVAMAAGEKTLEILANEAVHVRLEALGQQLESGVRDILRDRPVGFVRQGSIFWFSFGGRDVPRSAEGVSRDAAEPYSQFFRACLNELVYLAPSAYEVGFLSHAHSERDVEHAVAAFDAALSRVF